MCCGSVDCNGVLSEFSPEWTRRWKPENNAGCGCGCQACKNDCDTPSMALPGSPLAEWEAIYGKVMTTITFEQNEFGKVVQKVEKTVCPKKSTGTKRKECCSFRYRVLR